MQPFNSGTCFRHLHQREDSLLHASASGSGNDYSGAFFICGAFKHTGNFLADHRSHACAHKPEIHYAEHIFASVQSSLAANHGLVHTGLLFAGAQTLGIRLGVDKFQRVGRVHSGVHFLKRIRIGNQFNSFIGGHCQMVAAMRANVQILFELISIQGAAALFAFDPCPGRHLHAPAVRLDIKPDGGIFSSIKKRHLPKPFLCYRLYQNLQ